MSKIAGATVVGQGIRQHPQDQSALSFIDHDPVFVVKRHVQYLARAERSLVAPPRSSNLFVCAKELFVGAMSPLRLCPSGAPTRNLPYPQALLSSRRTASREWPTVATAAASSSLLQPSFPVQ